MKKRILITLIACLLMWPMGAFGKSLSSNEIMDRLEARYNVQGFFVQFHQTMTYKALGMTKECDGQIYIKRPGRMRWEYETPDKDLFITDGETLWVYFAEENQVRVGAVATFFGEGSVGAILSDITLIRKYYSVELIADDPAGYYLLKLSPDKPSGDIQVITLAVSKENFNIFQVLTENSTDDENSFTFEPPEFDRELDDALFTFTPPEGAEISSLDE